MASLGDFVTANLKRKRITRQGVFTKDNGDGTILVKGESGRVYCCEGPKGVSVVPDERLLFEETVLFVAVERKKIIRKLILKN